MPTFSHAASFPASPSGLRWILAAILGCSALSQPGCKTSAERALALEAAQMTQVVKQLRTAPHNQKQEPLQRLKQEPCTHPRVCEMKQICVQAYALHVKSSAVSNELRVALANGQQVDETGARAVLELSEQNLTRARQLMDACLEQETALMVETR